MLANMQEQLAQKEAKEQQLTAEWNEKWREAAKGEPNIYLYLMQYTQNC